MSLAAKSFHDHADDLVVVGTPVPASGRRRRALRAPPVSPSQHDGNPGGKGLIRRGRQAIGRDQGVIGDRDDASSGVSVDVAEGVELLGEHSIDVGFSDRARGAPLDQATRQAGRNPGELPEIPETGARFRRTSRTLISESTIVVSATSTLTEGRSNSSGEYDSQELGYRIS